jgi:magnesium transporter
MGLREGGADVVDRDLTDPGSDRSRRPQVRRVLADTPPETADATSPAEIGERLRRPRVRRVLADEPSASFVPRGTDARTRPEPVLPASAEPTRRTGPAALREVADPAATGRDEIPAEVVDAGPAEATVDAPVGHAPAEHAPADHAAVVPDGTEAGTADPDTPGPDTPGPGTAGPGTAGPGTAGPGTAEPDAPAQDVGLPPSVVDCALYVGGVRQPGPLHYREALARARQAGDGFVWLGVHEPTEEDFADIAATFHLHPLAVEDAVKAHQRPKLERYTEMTFVVLKTARYCEHDELTETSEVVETGDVMLFIGAEYVVSVRHGDACRLDQVRADLEAHTDLLAHGPWAVFHAVTDSVVDRYNEVVGAIEDDIDEVEAGVFSRQATDVQRIYHLKRELLEFKRAVVPLGRPLEMLLSGQVPSVPLEIQRYIRDVADHLQRVTDSVAAFDDLLTSILQADLAQIGIQQNNDMRKISAWIAIAAVPTMIAGIYGMNFDHMPEKHWVLGYPMVLLLMAGVCAGLHRAFRRSGWL